MFVLDLLKGTPLSLETVEIYFSCTPDSLILELIELLLFPETSYVALSG